MFVVGMHLERPNNLNNLFELMELNPIDQRTFGGTEFELDHS